MLRVERVGGAYEGCIERLDSEEVVQLASELEPELRNEIEGRARGLRIAYRDQLCVTTADNCRNVISMREDAATYDSEPNTQLSVEPVDKVFHREAKVEDVIEAVSGVSSTWRV